MESNSENLSRPLPHSADAERAILGAILLDNTILSQALEQLKTDDFYVASHKRIFDAMCALFERGGEIDPLTLADELKREGTADAVGGMMFITGLTYGLPHLANINEYTAIVRNQSDKRNLIRAGSLIISQALDNNEPAPVLREAAETMIYSLRRLETRGDEDSQRVADAVLQDIAAIQRDGVPPGVASGFTRLDALTGGWQKQDLIIIAARPSMGKSALAVNSAAHLVKSNPLAVAALFSLEMTRKAIIGRILCSEARVDGQRFRSGYLNQDEWARLKQVQRTFPFSRLLIDDTPAITPAYMRAKLRRWLATHGRLDLLITDYLQLAASGKARDESETVKTSGISQAYKAIAKEFDVPHIALSQLSRAPENRSDHRPILSDLRQSGQIEQDADVVGFIYRDEVYNPEGDNAGVAELIIAKQRNGPTGTVRLSFLKDFTRFENLFSENSHAPQSMSEPEYEEIVF